MNNINIIFEKIESTQTSCTCQSAMYLHRLYLNIEQNIEIYFKSIGKKMSNSASYHKDLMESYFDSFGLINSGVYKTINELRGFRHIFNKRADIFEFLEQNITTLKEKVLKIKDKIIEQFGEV